LNTLLKQAIQDNLFMNDLDEISEDFKEVDAEGWNACHEALPRLGGD